MAALAMSMTAVPIEVRLDPQRGLDALGCGRPADFAPRLSGEKSM
jgi:hypothetical protein